MTASSPVKPGETFTPINAISREFRQPAAQSRWWTALVNQPQYLPMILGAPPLVLWLLGGTVCTALLAMMGSDILQHFCDKYVKAFQQKFPELACKPDPPPVFGFLSGLALPPLKPGNLSAPTTPR